MFQTRRSTSTGRCATAEWSSCTGLCSARTTHLFNNSSSNTTHRSNPAGGDRLALRSRENLVTIGWHYLRGPTIHSVLLPRIPSVEVDRVDRRLIGASRHPTCPKSTHGRCALAMANHIRSSLNGRSVNRLYNACSFFILLSARHTVVVMCRRFVH